MRPVCLSVSFIKLSEHPGQPLDGDDTLVLAHVNDKDITGIVLFHEGQCLDGGGVRCE